MDIGEAADLSNIGTLFAFVLVSLGVLFLRKAQPDRPRAFKVPWVPVFRFARADSWLYSRRHSEFAPANVPAGKG